MTTLNSKFVITVASRILDAFGRNHGHVGLDLPDSTPVMEYVTNDLIKTLDGMVMRPTEENAKFLLRWSNECFARHVCIYCWNLLYHGDSINYQKVFDPSEAYTEAHVKEAFMNSLENIVREKGRVNASDLALILKAYLAIDEVVRTFKE